MTHEIRPAEKDPAVPPSGEAPPRLTAPGWNSEDWWSVAVGFGVLLVGLAATLAVLPADGPARVAALRSAQESLDKAVAAAPGASANDPAVQAAKKQVEARQAALASNPLAGAAVKLGSWKDDPRTAFVDKKGNGLLPGLALLGGICLVLFGVPSVCLRRPAGSYAAGFVLLFLLATLAFVLAGQEVVKHYNLEYALWALVVGLAIGNTVGTPRLLRTAANTEFYIKAGLVLLGAEVLFHRLLALGVPGMFVAWVTTPIVLVTTYIFGQRILKMESRSLNMTICADMSVCGVSAAIATAAACRAKKEELSLAIGLSLGFTVLMMIALPAFIRAVGMNPVLGGAWIGGTIDSTGAVAAAGGMLGPVALEVAATVKMIQNILIGVIAFAVAAYWVTYVEPRDAADRPGISAPRPGISAIWDRFPRFILGFLGASLLFSAIASNGSQGAAIAEAVTGVGSTFRNWFFCLAFVSIGLETNFRELRSCFAGGKPLILYVCGQTLNLVLTLFMAWLMFEKVFPDAAAALAR